jgi:gamma-glutamyltranspeptidase/glutathione hydrolase
MTPRSSRGLVATASPLASHAAHAVLARGGSAADAVVAAQAVLGLVEPHASGFGGSTVIVWHQGADGSSGVIDGLACAPLQVTERLEIDFDGRRIPRERVLFGGRTVAVPGTGRALDRLHSRFGRQSWATLFDAARGLAEEGFALPPYLVKTAQEVGPIQDDPLARSVYCQGGRRVQPAGTVVRNPAYAQTLAMIAEQGVDALYDESPISAAIVQAIHGDPMPGRLGLADLRAYKAIERECLAYTVGEQRILTSPPPVFGGMAVGHILGILHQLGHSAIDPCDSLDQMHLLCEAGRMAFADRSAYVGDPAFAEVPTAALLDAGYLAHRAAEIDRRHVLAEVAPGHPVAHLSPAMDGTGIVSAMTSHLVAIDAHGLAISMTTTINQNFGARLSAAGMFLNNALTNFARVPTGGKRRSANVMEPGKRPFTSFSPSIVCAADGQPEMLIGAGGGNRIVGFVANAILRMRAGQRDAQAIIDSPQVLNWNGMTDMEVALAGHARALALRGHWTMVRRMDGGTQGAIRNGGAWNGGAAPRRDGVALGV